MYLSLTAAAVTVATVLMFEHEGSIKTEVCVEMSVCDNGGIKSHAKRL